ncbi:hypothetical protein WJX84_007615 [Apatococcus fuscideae]|uniref:Uncharacterized protein n=1 Tax=Apatococcus fuscideae TaxID=2026836 RepID=A0AAW1TGV7_9CHLO
MMSSRLDGDPSSFAAAVASAIRARGRLHPLVTPDFTELVATHACTELPLLAALPDKLRGWPQTEASHEHVTLRPRIALEEKAAKQQEAHRAQEKQNRTRHALAELDQMRLAQLHNHQEKANVTRSAKPDVQDIRTNRAQLHISSSRHVESVDAGYRANRGSARSEATFSLPGNAKRTKAHQQASVPRRPVHNPSWHASFSSHTSQHTSQHSKSPEGDQAAVPCKERPLSGPKRPGRNHKRAGWRLYRTIVRVQGQEYASGRQGHGITADCAQAPTPVQHVAERLGPHTSQRGACRFEATCSARGTQSSYPPISALLPHQTEGTTVGDGLVGALHDGMLPGQPEQMGISGNSLATQVLSNPRGDHRSQAVPLTEADAGASLAAGDGTGVHDTWRPNAAEQHSRSTQLHQASSWDVPEPDVGTSVRGEHEGEPKLPGPLAPLLAAVMARSLQDHQRPEVVVSGDNLAPVNSCSEDEPLTGLADVAAGMDLPSEAHTSAQPDALSSSSMASSAAAKNQRDVWPAADVAAEDPLLANQASTLGRASADALEQLSGEAAALGSDQPALQTSKPVDPCAELPNPEGSRSAMSASEPALVVSGHSGIEDSQPPRVSPILQWALQEHAQETATPDDTHTGAPDPMDPVGMPIGQSGTPAGPASTPMDEAGTTISPEGASRGPGQPGSETLKPTRVFPLLDWSHQQTAEEVGKRDAEAVAAPIAELLQGDTHNLINAILARTRALRQASLAARNATSRSLGSFPAKAN